jgi:hypothetical protein
MPGLAIGFGDPPDQGLGTVQVTGPRGAIIQRCVVSESFGVYFARLYTIAG